VQVTNLKLTFVYQKLW